MNVLVWLGEGVGYLTDFAVNLFSVFGVRRARMFVRRLILAPLEALMADTRMEVDLR